MSNNGPSWVEVRRARVRCPICDEPDWCSISADGTASICMRVASPKLTRNGGWLHRLDGKQRPPAEKIHRPQQDRPLLAREIELLAQQYATALYVEKAAGLASGLGVSLGSLRRLGLGWCAKLGAWTFPMRRVALDARRSKVSGFPVVGFRTRFPDGSKRSIKGGREGLFIPEGLDFESRQLLICEGPTSLAALLDLGYEAIGRPSCNSGNDIVRDFLVGRRREVVILGDRDEVKGDGRRPGQDGAHKLAGEIADLCAGVRVVIPPRHKDARDWVKAGGTRAMVDAVIAAARWMKARAA